MGKLRQRTCLMAEEVILGKTRWSEIPGEALWGEEAGVVGVVSAPVPEGGDVSDDFQQSQTP